MNPYKVLGVSETATPDEIRAAYLALVKKYHPDRYADGPLKEMAGEKLKEINRAYELIGKRTGAGAHADAGRAASYGPERTSRNSAYAGPNAAALARVRSLISHNNLGAAAAILDSIHLHNAEWHYLYGIIYLRQGWYERARACICYAYEQEPDNSEYRNAYAALHRTSAAYAEDGESAGGGTLCDDCSTLLCCNCCGRAFCCC